MGSDISASALAEAVFVVCEKPLKLATTAINNVNENNLRNMVLLLFLMFVVDRENKITLFLQIIDGQ
ncbi:hypothetical protein MASR1M107_25120 [Ignavibacteriales bacterium]